MDACHYEDPENFSNYLMINSTDIEVSTASAHIWTLHQKKEVTRIIS